MENAVTNNIMSNVSRKIAEQKLIIDSVDNTAQLRKINKVFTDDVCRSKQHKKIQHFLLVFRNFSKQRRKRIQTNNRV